MGVRQRNAAHRIHEEPDCPPPHLPGTLAQATETKRTPEEVSLDLAVHGVAISAALIGTLILLTNAGSGPDRGLDIALSSSASSRC
jgi:hypothetical protein